MYKEYCQAILKSLEDAVSDYPSIISIIDADSENYASQVKAINGSDIDCIVSVNNEYNFVTETVLDGAPIPLLDKGEGSRLFDYRQTMPINIRTSFFLVTKSIEKSIELEDLIISKYPVGLKLDICTSKGENVDLVLCRHEEIERNEPIEVDGVKLFFSAIHFKEINAFFDTPEYHQAQIDFDSSIQKEIMGRIVALQEVADNLRKNLPPQMHVEGIGSYTPSEEELEISKRADYYVGIAREQLELLRKYPEDMKEPFLCKLVYDYMIHEKASLHDTINGFQENRELMESAYKSYKTIKMQEAEQAEKERLESIEVERANKEREERKSKSFETRGDVVRNAVLDAIMCDITQRVGIDADWTIYNGTDYMQYRKNNEEHTLPDLWMAIESNDRYRFPNTNPLKRDPFNDDKYMYDSNRANERQISENYSDITFKFADNNNQMNYYYGFDVLPIEYNVILEMGCEEESKLATLESVASEIMSAYSNPFILPVKVVGTENQYIGIDMQVKSMTPIDKSGAARIDILFMPIRTAYIRNNIAYNDVENDPRLQKSILKQAEHKLAMYAILKYEAIRDYKATLGDYCTPNILGNMLVSGLKQFRQSVQRKTPDIRLFKDLFPVLSQAYPMLLDQLCNGWSYEQICGEIEKVTDKYKEGYLEDMRLLSPCIGDFEYSIERDTWVLDVIRDIATVDDYLNVAKNPCMFISDAFEGAKAENEKLFSEFGRFESDDFGFDDVDDGFGNTGFGNTESHDYSRGGGGQGGSILRGAISAYLGTKGMQKELRKQTELMEREADERRRENNRREQEDRRREYERKLEIERREKEEKFAHNRHVDSILKANEERRKKGLPELPVPPRRF